MSFSSYVEKMYQDKLSVIRYVEIENDDGTTGVMQDNSKSLIDIPCRISSLKMDERNTVSWDVDDVEARLKIFLSPKIEIFKGDEVIAERYVRGKNVQSHKGYAGDPLVYDLAQEFILLEKRVKTNEL